MSNGNPTPRFFSGTTAEQPLATAVPTGTEFFDTTKLTFQVVAKVGGVNTWELLGGLNTLSKYWVTPNAALPPFGAYNTVQAAINAAAADGHTAANPAAILILPGVYASEPGNVITMKDGVYLFGISQASRFSAATDVLIEAQITFDNACARSAIVGCEITGIPAGGQPVILVSGTSILAELTVQESIIRGNGVGCHHMDYTGTNAACAIAFVQCSLFNVTAQTGDAGIVMNSPAGSLTLIDTIFSVVATDNVLDMKAGPTAVNLTRTSVTGIIFNNNGTNTFTFQDVDQNVTGANTYLNAPGGTPTFNCTRYSRTGSTQATPYAGTFTINDTDHQGDANSETILSTMTTGVQARTARRMTGVAAPGASINATQFQAAGDMVLVNTSGGVGAVALPARNLVPKGLRKSIMASPGGANATTITPNGTDTINGTNAAITTGATLKSGAVLVADPNNTTNWLVESVS